MWLWADFAWLFHCCVQMRAGLVVAQGEGYGAIVGAGLMGRIRVTSLQPQSVNHFQVRVTRHTPLLFPRALVRLFPMCSCCRQIHVVTEFPVQCHWWLRMHMLPCK